jgi:hypothetical protein
MARPIRIYGDDDPRSVLPLSEEGWPEELGARIATPDKSPAARKAALKAALDLSPEDKSLDPARQALRNLATVSVEQGEPVILSRKPMPQAKPRPLSAEQGQDILAGIKGAVPEAMAKAGLEQPKQEALAEAPGVAPLPVREFQKMAMGGAGEAAQKPPAPPQAPPEQPAAPRPLRPEVAQYMAKKYAPEDAQYPRSPSVDEEQAAQEKSRRLQLLSDLGAAGEMAGSAIARKRADTGYWDKLGAGAGKPLDELEKRRALVREHLKEKAAADLRERGFKLQEDETAYKRQRDAAGDARTAALDAERKAAANDPYAKQKRDLELKKLEADIRKANRPPSAGHGAGGARDEYYRWMAESKRREVMGEKLPKEIERETQGFGKDVADLIPLQTMLERVKASIPGGIDPNVSDDIPGIGMLDSILPNALVGDDGRKMRQQLANLLAQTIKELSGAVASEPEVRRIKAMLGQGSFRTERELREALSDLDLLARRKMEAAEAKWGPEAAEAYRGGVRGSGRGRAAEGGGHSANGTEAKGGLDLGGAQAGGQQDSAAVQWAKANPNDPRAAKILEMNGVR